MNERKKGNGEERKGGQELGGQEVGGVGGVRGGDMCKQARQGKARQALKQ